MTSALTSSVQKNLPPSSLEAKRIFVANKILTAEPIPHRESVEEGRYKLRVNWPVPGQWRRAEVERILELTENWRWGGILDTESIQELEQLLDSVAKEAAV